MSDQVEQPQAGTTAASTVYQDEDLVYVDPQTRTVVGRVEFLPNGKSKPLAMPMPAKAVADDDDAEEEPKAKGKGARPRRQRFYPWGTYRAMKHIYKIEGKQIREENRRTLDDVIEKALKEPFWD